MQRKPKRNYKNNEMEKLNIIKSRENMNEIEKKKFLDNAWIRLKMKWSKPFRILLIHYNTGAQL